MYQLCIVFLLTLTRTFFRWPCPVWFLEWPDWISHSDFLAGLECLHWQVLRWLAQTADSFSRVFLSPCKEKKRDPTWQFWKRVQFFISPLARPCLLALAIGQFRFLWSLRCLFYISLVIKELKFRLSWDDCMQPVELFWPICCIHHFFLWVEPKSYHSPLFYKKERYAAENLPLIGS